MKMNFSVIGSFIAGVLITAIILGVQLSGSKKALEVQDGYLKACRGIVLTNIDWEGKYVQLAKDCKESLGAAPEIAAAYLECVRNKNE